MGDHTDYNQGFVLPMAINRDCLIEYRHTPTGNVSVNSSVRVDRRLVDSLARSLVNEGMGPAGIDATISSEIPIGSGLASSAAFEVVLALALLDAANMTLDNARLAKACRDAEEAATGVPCGIMDQLVCLEGRAGHALLIDCRSLEIEPVPIPEDLRVIAVHSGISRNLRDTAYAERRRACEAAAAGLGVMSLREATLEQVSDIPVARHVVSENSRVVETAAALRVNDTVELARLFRESQESLRDDLQVSTPEVDALVDSLMEAGAIGARITGAGFGGCVVALTRDQNISKQACDSYKLRTGLVAQVFECIPSEGAAPTVTR